MTSEGQGLDEAASRIIPHGSPVQRLALAGWPYAPRLVRGQVNPQNRRQFAVIMGMKQVGT